MKKEYKMSLEELKKLPEIKIVVDKNAFKAQECICIDCGIKLEQQTKDKAILNGALTFHIIILKCPKCNKEYLNLEQAERYDFFLALEKVSKEKPLGTLIKTFY